MFGLKQTDLHTVNQPTHANSNVQYTQLVASAGWGYVHLHAHTSAPTL